MSDDDHPDQKTHPLSGGALVFFALFGVYLLLGAFVAVRDGKWPIFMPPQLDLIGLLLSIFGNPLGAYLGAAVLGVLGVTFIAGAIVAGLRSA